MPTVNFVYMYLGLPLQVPPQVIGNAQTTWVTRLNISETKVIKNMQEQTHQHAQRQTQNRIATVVIKISIKGTCQLVVKKFALVTAWYLAPDIYVCANQFWLWHWLACPLAYVTIQTLPAIATASFTFDIFASWMAIIWMAY